MHTYRVSSKKDIKNLIYHKYNVYKDIFILYN